MMLQRAMEFSWLNDKRMECREYIHVFNTYPVYLKIQHDISKGIYLFDELKTYDLQRKQSITKFISKINMPLMDFITSQYSNFKRNKADFENFNNSKYKIEEIIHGDFKLIFIRTYRQLVFANYVDKHINTENISDYIIPDIPSLNMYRHNIKFNNNVYRTINTCNAFLSFGKINRLNIDDGLNSTFYGSFQISLSKEDESYSSKDILRILSDGERKVLEVNIFSQQKTGYLFKCVMIGDTIIITKYMFGAEDMDDLM